MLNPEEIHRRAEREREKQAQRNKRQRRGPREKRFFPLKPESFKIFHRIYPHYPSMLWLMIPLVLATIGGTLWVVDKKGFKWVLPYLLYIMAVPVIVYTITFIRELIEYQTYKTWRRGLGFPVNGWERLGESEKFPKYKYWDNVTVIILTKSSTTSATLKLIDDVLFLFTAAANGTFYAADQVQPGASGDIRKKWQRTGLLEVSGSANSSVMGQLYLCIHKHLRAIHKEYGCIEAVNIKYAKQIFEVQMIQISSD